MLLCAIKMQGDSNTIQIQTGRQGFSKVSHSVELITYLNSLMKDQLY